MEKTKNITEGDIKLLSHIAEYRFLTVKQLSAVSKRPIQVVRRRLRHLGSERLAIMGERGFGKGPGRRENIVILTENGLELLKSNKILSKHALYITDKTPGSMFVDHDLLVNWFFIHLLQIERKNPQLSSQQLTTSSHDLKEGSAEKSLLMECFSTDETFEGTHTMIPDGVFTITNKESEKTLLFFLEADMGTETAASTNRNPKDIRQKIVNYKALFQSNNYKRYEKIFNAELIGFRLLFLCNTHSRMKSLCKLIQEMPPSDFIWLTDQEQMFAQGIAANIWIRGGHQQKALESILGKRLSFVSTVIDKIK